MSEKESLDLKSFLKQELMEEVYEVGHCGVYDLVWTLRGHENTLTDSERVVLAKQVARETLDSGEVQIYKFRWPPREPISGPLTLDDLAEGDWLDIPESGEHPAFVAVGA